MAIEDSSGHKIAELKKRTVGVVRDNFVVKIRGDRDWRELLNITNIELLQAL